MGKRSRSTVAKEVNQSVSLVDVRHRISRSRRDEQVQRDADVGKTDWVVVQILLGEYELARSHFHLREIRRS